MQARVWTCVLSGTVSPKITVHSETQNMNLSGNRVFADVISSVKRRSCWTQVQPHSNDWCPYRQRDTNAQGRRDVTASQGKLRLASHHQKLEEARRERPLEPSEGLWTGRHLDFQLLASRDAREQIPVALSTQSAVLFSSSPRKPL